MAHIFQNRLFSKNYNIRFFFTTKTQNFVFKTHTRSSMEAIPMFEWKWMETQKLENSFLNIEFTDIWRNQKLKRWTACKICSIVVSLSWDSNNLLRFWYEETSFFVLNAILFSEAWNSEHFIGMPYALCLSHVFQERKKLSQMLKSLKPSGNNPIAHTPWLKKIGEETAILDYFHLMRITNNKKMSQNLNYATTLSLIILCGVISIFDIVLSQKLKKIVYNLFFILRLCFICWFSSKRFP